jgi:hypothetical protein
VAGLNGHANGTREVTSSAGPVGEIVDTSVAQFAAQACAFGVAPPFGAFVKVLLPERAVYGLVYAIHSGSLEPGRSTCHAGAGRAA